MEDSTAYQMILKKGLAKGLAEGEAKGLAEGRAQDRREGELVEVRRFLLRMGEEQLGPPSAEIAAANAVRYVRRLETMGKLLPRVESWQELLRKPGNRPKPRSRPRA